MSRFLLLLSLLLPALSWGGQFERFFDGLTGFTADFEQTVIDAQDQTIQQSAGEVAILRPDRFRWDYVRPYRQLVLGDGQTLWSYDADLEQATAADQQAALAGTPAVLLASDRPVDELFEVVQRNEVDGGEVVVLAARDPDSAWRRVLLAFSGGVLTGMELGDGFGQTTRIHFRNPRRNPPLDPARFRFEPPPGTDVIRAPAP